MSVQSLYTAATGMQALETKLDVVANNLANINTTAFKKGRCNFEDLFYRQIKIPGAQDAQGNFTPTGIAVGLGTRVESIQTDFGQGAFQQTNGQFDVAIEGSTIRLRHNGSGSVFEYLWFKDAPHLRNATVRPAPSAEAGRLAANAERAALHQLNAANLVEAA